MNRIKDSTRYAIEKFFAWRSWRLDESVEETVKVAW